ncbi:MAG: ATP-binding protein [bacterium]
MLFVSHRVLYKIAKEINSSLDTSKVLNAIVQTITEAMEAKGSALLLLSPDGRELIHTVDYGLSDWYIKKGPVQVDSFIAEILKGKPEWIPNVAADPRTQYPEEAKKEGIASVLSLPFRFKDEVIGVLRIYLSRPRSFSEEAIEFLDAAANLGAIALVKAHLYESQVRDLENTTAQMKALAEEKARFMHFFGIAAHDLKAPLEAIQSYLWVILGGYAGELNPKHRTMIERSSIRLDNLLSLISDLLDVTRVGVGRIFDELEDVPLNKVLETCLEMAQDLARSKDIQIIVDTPKRLPVMHSSSLRLQQILSNLLTNAIKYSDNGTKVTLRIKVKKTQINVEVIDEGIGIPEKDLPYLFEEFFRAKNVGEREGTGLGLYIVKRIIDAHKGRIWMESPCTETGRGSKFAFVLPCAIK